MALVSIMPVYDDTASASDEHVCVTVPTFPD